MKKLLSLALLFLSLHATSQSDTASLEEVVVTASRMQQKQSQTGKVVTVIDQQAIANNAGKTVTELLNTRAGIFINGANNPLGSNIDASFRGLGAGNFLIVVDGVAVYDPSEINSTFDLNHISLDQVEKIEILKGGQSTLWGSNAVAGVIQVFLKKGKINKTELNVASAYGSYGTSRNNVSFTVGGKKYSVHALMNYIKSDGFSAATDSTRAKPFDKDGFSQINLVADASYRFAGGLTAKLFTAYNRYKADLDGAPYEDDRDFTTDNKNVLAGVGLAYNRNKINWNLNASLQTTNRSFTDDSLHKGTAFYEYAYGGYNSTTINIESFGNVRLHNKLQLVAGVQYLQQRMDQHYLSIDNSIPAPYNKFEAKLGKDSVKANQLSAYASMVLSDVKGFNMELGGRVNRHSIYGTNGTFTFNPSYNIDNNSRVFINISKGYKVPSLYQLYSEFGNKQLKPESSTTYELGFSTQTEDKRLFIRVVGFKRDIKDLIAFYFNPTTFEAFYMNRDKQNDHGIEIESEAKLSTWGQLNIQTAFVDGKGTVDNQKVANLYRRPRFTFNSSMSIVPFKGVTVAPSIRYVGARTKAPGDYGLDIQPEYYTVDLLTAYQWKKYRLFVELRNITDQDYFDIPGYNTRRFNYMVGLSASF